MSTRRYTCAQLAALALPGYPGTERGWLKLVQRDGWASVEVPVRGGLKGVGREYIPPAKLLPLIAERVLQAQPAPQPIVVPQATTAVSSEGLTQAQRLERDARTAVLTAVAALQQQVGCSQSLALETLLKQARAGNLDVALDRVLRLARDARGRQGDGLPSKRSERPGAPS